MAIKVLLITQWFDPEPTFKGLVFARELVRQGFQVEVLTGFPNYPGGKLYPGYEMKWLRQEKIDGVTVTRVPLYPSHSHSSMGRALNYLSFAGSAIIYGLLRAKRPDVIYAYHPPLTLGIVAVLLRFFRRVPVVYDIQDMWPDTLRATGMITNPRILGFIGGVCDWVYRNVNHIVVLSPGFKILLVERGVADCKIDVIYNWCDEKSLCSPTEFIPTTFPNSSRFRILFAGNMGKAQALDAILDAAKLIGPKFPQICFVFLGGGVEVERLKQIVLDENLENVCFIAAVPMALVGRMLVEADALLVHLRKDPLFKITIPSKTQAYMAVGKPILMAVDGDAADLVRLGECGVVSQSEDPESIAAAAIELFHSDASVRVAMGESSRRFYEKHLSLEVGTRRFADIFERLSKRTRAEAAP